MSSESVEHIHERIRDELDRLGLKMAEAARAMGEESSQGLRDVCSGRKRASAELIAKLGKVGADTTYILTGDYLSVAQAKAVLDSNAPTSAHLTNKELADQEVTEQSNRQTSAGLTGDEQELLVLFRAARLAQKMEAVAVLSAKPNSPTKGSGIKVSGPGNRVAGRDFNERKE